MKNSRKRIAPVEMRRALLDWYGREGRALPWRVRPEDRERGLSPDPYAVWLSEIMLQQTTVPHATPYYERFLERWPTVHDLAAADESDVLAAWAGLGYYARARNLIVCAGRVAGSGGEFPSSEKALLDLPGIGPYTAAAIRAAAFDRPANVVDGNVERVVARIHALETPLPKAKTEIRKHAAVLADPDRPGDYAQALMDLGAVVCTPRSPACAACPWSAWCAARGTGAPEDYPRKAPKTARPTRFGTAFIVTREGRVWLRKRPPRGLLGGMLEVPSTSWIEGGKAPEFSDAGCPFPADWWGCGEVRHVFTHFNLRLDVRRAEADPGWDPEDGALHGTEDLDRLPLPSLMRKVLEIGLPDDSGI